MGTWDDGLPYEHLKERIRWKVTHQRDLLRKGDRRYRSRLAYLVVYAIQLRNGLRISEAFEAFKSFLAGKHETWEVEVEGGKKLKKKVVAVNVAKKKKNADVRNVTWPEFVPFSVLREVKKASRRMTVRSLVTKARQIIGTNTHTLRYARASSLMDDGVDGMVVSKIYRHSKPLYTFRYYQKGRADLINAMKE